MNGEEAEAVDNESDEDEKGAIHKMLGREWFGEFRSFIIILIYGTNDLQKRGIDKPYI